MLKRGGGPAARSLRCSDPIISGLNLVRGDRRSASIPVSFLPLRNRLSKFPFDDNREQGLSLKMALTALKNKKLKFSCPKKRKIISK